jgi:hypothetical protein
MAQTLNGTDTGIVNRSKRTYVAVTDTTAFYSYTVAMNASYVTTGTLAENGTTLSRGTLLRENGKRLFPDANPGVTKFLVGVFLTESPFTSGFIDPNAGFFVLYNGDKPTYLGGSSDFVGLAGGTPSIPSLLTIGSVTAGTGVVATTGGVVATAGQIRAATVTALTAYTVANSGAFSSVTRNIDPTLGQVFTLAISIGTSVTNGPQAITLTCTTTPAAGSIVYVIINATTAGTTGLTIVEGTNVQMNTVTIGTSAGYRGLTFVSDGANLVQVGAGVVATVE